MAKRELTEERIREARTSGKRYLWDGTRHDDGSLGVYIGKGRMSYIYKYSCGGKELQVTIGTDKELTLTKAKAEADKLRDKRLAREPILSAKAERIASENAELAAKSVSVYFVQYHKQRDDGTLYWHNVKLSYDRNVSTVIGDLRINRVTKANIKLMLGKTSESVALFVYTFLNPFFDWCVDKGYLEASPMQGVRRPKPAVSRDRILSEDEIRAFWRSSDKLGYPFGPMCKLLLLTGQRRDEVAGLRWSEIDRTKSVWIIPKARTKNSKEHLVHLSPQALEVLDSLPRMESQFAFTTTLKTAVSGYSKVKERLDKLMAAELGKDIEEWRLHDIRRSAASAMRGLRIQKDTIELVLNHTSGERGGLVGVYQRHELLDERKAAIIALGGYVEGLMRSGDSNDSNVVEFKRA